MLMIKESTGRTLYIQTYRGETIGDLRCYLCEQYHYLKDQIRISHKNQELPDNYVFNTDDVFELFCLIPSSETSSDCFFQGKKEESPFTKLGNQFPNYDIEPCPRRITKPVQNQTEKKVHKTKIHHISVTNNKNNSISNQHPNSLSALLN